MRTYERDQYIKVLENLSFKDQPKVLVNGDKLQGDKRFIWGNASGLKGIVSPLLWGDVTGVKGTINPRLEGCITNVKGVLSADLYGIVSHISGVLQIRLFGDVTHIRGDISGIYGRLLCISGDMTGIEGDVSGKTGDFSFVKGNLDGLDDNPHIDGNTVIAVLNHEPRYDPHYVRPKDKYEPELLF